MIVEKFTDEIAEIKRLRNSQDGNPAYRVLFKSGRSHRTVADAQIAFLITNSEYWAGPVAVTLNNDQIAYAEPVKA